MWRVEEGMTDEEGYDGRKRMWRERARRYPFSGLTLGQKKLSEGCCSAYSLV